MPQTVQNAEDNTDKITYNGRQFLKYFSLPDTNLNTAIISNSHFRKDHETTLEKRLIQSIIHIHIKDIMIV